jgi:hypothetical protein
MEINDNIFYALIAVVLLLGSRFLYVEIFSRPSCIKYSTQNVVNNETATVNIPSNNNNNNNNNNEIMNCNGDKCYV